MKILLTTVNVSYIHQNLAIRILYFLNKDIAGLQLKEFFVKSDYNEAALYCSSFNIVAFSCYIWNIETILKLAETIKTINPDCKILLGGPEVSFDNHLIINNPNIDFIISGEGELPFRSFLQNYPDLTHVPSLIWKQNNIVITNSAQVCTNLDFLNQCNPYIFDNPDELKNKINYVEASRGCPFTCTFCMSGIDNNLRFISEPTLFSNLHYLMQHGRVIKFLDRTFNSNKHFAIKIFKYILENRKPDNIFQFEIKADILHQDIIDFLEQNTPKGIFRFEIGIQTLVEKANEATLRKQNFDKIKSVITRLSPVIEMHLDLIAGLPHEYYSDIKYSFEQVFQLFAPELQLGFLKFLKGTSIRDNAGLHGYVFSENPPYQIISSHYLNPDEIADIHLVEQMLDIYWNRKRAKRVLKYMAQHGSVFNFLLQLGQMHQQSYSENNFTANNSFQLIYNTAISFEPNNLVLQQLIAIEYYLHHKVCPGVKFVPEISKSEKIKILDNLNFNTHKYRYIIIGIDFNFALFDSTNCIEMQQNILVFEYNGKNTAQITVL